MTFDEIYNDVDNIRITEFMEAISEKPVKQDGNILTYNAPYNMEEPLLEMGISTKGKPTCLVDTNRNVWRDSNYTPWQPLTMLMLEMSWTYNPERLKAMVATIIHEHRKKQEGVGEKIGPKPKEKPEPPKKKRGMRL